MINKIEIPFNKTKASLLFIFPIFLIVTSLICYMNPDWFVSNIYSDPARIKMIGVLGTILGVIVFFMMYKMWMTKKVGLLIDSKGITNYSNSAYKGLIEWNDIVGFKRLKAGPIKGIAVLIKDPNKYINKAKKMSIKSMRQANHHHGSPLIIVSSMLKVKLDKLNSILQSEFEKIKKPNNSLVDQ